MKCDFCDYEGEVERGWYRSKEGCNTLPENEYWKCPACGLLTKISEEEILPQIKGYCKTCSKAQIDAMLPDGIYECVVFDWNMRHDDYCSRYEKAVKYD